MKYDEIILKDLVAIYEKRDANSSNFRTSVKIKLNKDKYPKYFEDTLGYDESIRDEEQNKRVKNWLAWYKGKTKDHEYYVYNGKKRNKRSSNANR